MGFRNSFSPFNKDKTESKHSWFSTFGGMLAAAAAFITAIVSLANSCSSANKAIIDKVDKVEVQCKTETDQRTAAVTDVFNKGIASDQELKTKIQNNRELEWEYYRRLEMRVEQLEPGVKGKNRDLPPE